MAEYQGEYLTTKELADLLRIKERKIYDLASSGEIPCTRALGKLLFQRSAIDAWLSSHNSGKETVVQPLPMVVIGSHDPLLEWSLRESTSGLATFFNGSLDGLARFVRREGVATGLHIFDPDTAGWNVAAVRERFGNQPVVLVEWAWRERGLIVAAGNPLQISGMADLAGKRVAPRQPESGTQVLFDHLAGEAGLAADAMTFTHAARTETDAAIAILDGHGDAALGLKSVASQLRLDFVPVVRERFDLLVWRRQWFEPPFQQFLEVCRSPAFAEKVADMAGYDVSGLGTVHFNGA